MTLAAGAHVDPRAAREGVAHLCRVDPALHALIERVGPYGLAADRGPDHFGALAQAIVYQQLAGKVAAVIHARFLALFPGPPDARLVAGDGRDRAARVGTLGREGARRSRTSRTPRPTGGSRCRSTARSSDEALDLAADGGPTASARGPPTCS